MSETMQQENSRIQVVTNDNFNEYVNKQMGIDPEVEAAKEAERLAAIQAEQEAKEKAEEEDPTATLEEHKEVPKEKRNKLQERFSKLTSERKEALERAQKALEEAEAAKKAADEHRRLAEELKNKYEPPKADLGPKPSPNDFTDINEYSKALEDWTSEKTIREAKEAEIRAKEEAKQKALVDNWVARQNEFKSQTPDYEQALNDAADIGVSDQIKEAILDSDVGPQLLYHLAKNKDFAVELGQMSTAKALKEIGKLEDRFSSKSEKQEQTTSVAEISKAPAPISPLKGASNPVSSLRGSDEVPKSMTYEEWKAKRKAGQIR